MLAALAMAFETVGVAMADESADFSVRPLGRSGTGKTMYFAVTALSRAFRTVILEAQVWCPDGSSYDPAGAALTDDSTLPLAVGAAAAVSYDLTRCGGTFEKIRITPRSPEWRCLGCGEYDLKGSSHAPPSAHRPVVQPQIPQRAVSSRPAAHGQPVIARDWEPWDLVMPMPWIWSSELPSPLPGKGDTISLADAALNRPIVSSGPGDEAGGEQQRAWKCPQIIGYLKDGKYPELMTRDGAAVAVTVHVTVNDRGLVTDAWIDEDDESVFAGIDIAALAVARDCRFDAKLPAPDTTYRIPIHFDPHKR